MLIICRQDLRESVNDQYLIHRWFHCLLEIIYYVYDVSPSQFRNERLVIRRQRALQRRSPLTRLAQ